MEGEQMKDFDKALKFVLRWEGFISDDPNDKGGLTIWGISRRSHKNAVDKMNDLIHEEKKDEAFKIAEKIYYEVYWLKVNCNMLSYPMNIVMFDTAVNMGRSRANKLFDQCTGDWRDYLLLRLYTYSKFKLAKLYFRGWANRVLDLYITINKFDK